eukprot:CAMPEP_0119014318 /NCGR_PEP_ID=MMETSP1176-20130426/9506_1 /TAXON_ID=265551 /ORGANISM="Synedropsis recta cf, Strain CCMP1620" /LENGTH=116 /DNA_ID=CAMNT_0006967473 /DNA_START=16 /DNA_END=366 /DNA_ORIENTATION=-
MTPRAVFILVLLFVVGAGAFSPVNTLLRPTAPKLALSSTRTLPTVTSTTSSITTTALHAAKKDIKKKEPKKKLEWDFGLVLVYMNPLRNPNSIFLYMFLSIIVLGKYGETHPHIPH